MLFNIKIAALTAVILSLMLTTVHATEQEAGPVDAVGINAQQIEEQSVADPASALADDATDTQDTASTATQSSLPAESETERWNSQVLELLEEINLGKKSEQDADALYLELSKFLRGKLKTLHQALRWASSPQETLSGNSDQDEGQGQDPPTVEDVYTDMVSLYQTRIILLQAVSPGLKAQITGLGQAGQEKLKAEMEYMLLYLRFHAMAIPQLGPQLLTNLIGAPLLVAWELLLLMLAILLFRWWRQWAPQGLVDLRSRIVQIRPRTQRTIRLARLVWYFQQVRSPLEWMLLLSFVFDTIATPSLSVIEDFVQIILNGVLFAWLAVSLINAIASRGVAGLSDDTSGLRLRSLKLIAGWILVLSLGLKLTETYTGQGTTYATVWTLFEVLTVPVVILLLTWWRLEIRQNLQELPALPGWVEKTTQSRGGLKRYLNVLLGGFYLVFIFLRQLAVRQLSKFESGREIVVTLIGRELNRELGRQNQPEEMSPISDQVSNQLIDQASIITEKIYLKELRRLTERVNFGHGGIVAVVGERGLGKSLLMDRLAQNFDGKSIVVKCGMQGFDGVKQVFAEHFQVPVEQLDANRLAELVETSDVRLIAFDNLHYLVRPKMGGDLELNRLIEFMGPLRSKLKICLVITMVKPAYQYIRSLRSDSALLEDFIELPTWTQEQISELIEARNLRAGIEPDFSRIEIPYQYDDIDYDSPEERTQSGFYRILWGVSGGNPVVAMQLWSNSLAVTPEGRVVVQILPQVFAGDQLENASLSVLLILRVIVQSGLTTAADITESLRLPASVIENGMRFALFHGWIEDIDGYYQITWRWFRTINRVLIRQNLLTR